MSFFHWCMRNAAGLLFVIALLIIVIGLLPLIQELIRSFSRPRGMLSSAETSDWTMIYSTIVGSLAGAIWPLFGAALLYRLDRHWGRPPHRSMPEEAE